MKFEYGGITLEDFKSENVIHFKCIFSDGSVKVFDVFDKEQACTLYHAMFDFYGILLKRLEVY